MKADDDYVDFFLDMWYDFFSNTRSWFGESSIPVASDTYWYLWQVRSNVDFGYDEVTYVY